jgi:heat shock protein HtpX
MTGHPEWLPSGLAKLDNYARGISMHDADPQTAHMFIINPFTGHDVSLKQLFSTHPSTEQRIERLEALKH